MLGIIPDTFESCFSARLVLVVPQKPKDVLKIADPVCVTNICANLISLTSGILRLELRKFCYFEEKSRFLKLK